MKFLVLAIVTVIVGIEALIPLVSALDSCKDPGIIGDADNNGVLNIEDAYPLLGFLFLGEAGPHCLERGDVNGDGFINNNDLPYLLDYLFQKGDAPKSLDGEVIYFQGTDELPDIALSLHGDEIIHELLIGAELFDLTNDPGIPTSENIRTTGDIVKCKIDVYENGALIGTTFSANWPEGIGFSNFPLEFSIGDNDGVIIEEIEHAYDLEAECTDAKGNTGTAQLEFETKKLEIPSEPLCRRDIDVCCKSTDDDILSLPLVPGNPASPKFDAAHIFTDQFANSHGTHYACVRSCTEVMMKEDGTMETICGENAQRPSCGQIKPFDVIAGFDSRLEWGGPQIPRAWNEVGSSPEAVALCNNLDSDHVHPAVKYDFSCWLGEPQEPPIDVDIEPQEPPINPTKAEKKQENTIKHLANEPTPKKTPCFVDSVRVISDPEYYARDVDGIREDFKFNDLVLTEAMQKLKTDKFGETAPFIVPNNNIPLGHYEGYPKNEFFWKKEFIYLSAFGFFVIANLEPISKHENCLHAQYVQIVTEVSGLDAITRFTSDKMGETPPKERSHLMSPKSDIFKKSLSQLPKLTNEEIVLDKNLKQFRGLREFETKLNPDEIAERDTYCFTDGSFGRTFDWCPDDYVEKSDILKYIPVGIMNKNGLCKKKPPKIIWYDNPRYRFFTYVTDATDPPPGRASVDNNQHAGNLNLISIIEDSQAREDDKEGYEKGYQYRWVCSQNQLKFRDNPAWPKYRPKGSIESNRLKIVTPPSCSCQKQRRLPGEDYLNDGPPVAC